MKIGRFEDIEAWQTGRKLTNLVFEMTRRTGFNADIDLTRQIRRAAISSMANIAEGFDAGSDAEFQRFLRIAQRSATEVQSHLYVALDERYIESEEFNLVYAQAQQTRKVIGGFIRYLQTSS